MSIFEKLNRARDVVANYGLIEQEELMVDLDGRQHFEACVKEAMSADATEAQRVLDEMRPFTTTSWKEPHPEASGGRITWPWSIS